ncbi:thioredoxin fold domain-containing protein [uncultured Tenacibaculum sp.]|uniref:thioredoxin fold domain-containing protein n=1 Tax=uncultured Tenacibaculum sp. TaxID=174713 RepID=UPI00261DC076|nr:thioredoxin fold domain-containing protein [uncultured Tenacibaculum sp.]
MILKKITYILLLYLLPQSITAQQNSSINWITFQQLEDSLSVKPKKVFIDFYADWCIYCKKMEKVAFKNPKVISKLNTSYYAVKMNAESTDKIFLGGDTFINKQIGKKRNPTHDIPLLLASRNNKDFSLPAIIILDEKFKISARYFEYLDSKKMLKAINQNK